MAGELIVNFNQPIAVRATKIHQRHYEPTGDKMSGDEWIKPYRSRNRWPASTGLPCR
jgi:hypothetical protein